MRKIPDPKTRENVEELFKPKLEPFQFSESEKCALYGSQFNCLCEEFYQMNIELISDDESVYLTLQVWVFLIVFINPWSEVKQSNVLLLEIEEEC